MPIVPRMTEGGHGSSNWDPREASTLLEPSKAFVLSLTTLEAVGSRRGSLVLTRVQDWMNRTASQKVRSRLHKRILTPLFAFLTSIASSSFFWDPPPCQLSGPAEKCTKKIFDISGHKESTSAPAGNWFSYNSDKLIQSQLDQMSTTTSAPLNWESVHLSTYRAVVARFRLSAGGKLKIGSETRSAWIVVVRLKTHVHCFFPRP